MTPGSLVADRFEIVAPAGTGGMGVVYRALDRQTGMPVALKVLHGRARGPSERATREAEALASLAHPCFVGYVAHGVTENGKLYLAMEWVEGETLSSRLQRQGLTIPETVALGVRLAGALDAAHQRGMVHRDIKPSNILLRDDVSEAKI